MMQEGAARAAERQVEDSHSKIIHLNTTSKCLRATFAVSPTTSTSVAREKNMASSADFGAGATSPTPRNTATWQYASGQ